MKKKIMFISGTRADFGKLKSLILRLQKNKNFKIFVFVTGMHLLQEYGMTWLELKYAKIKNVIKFNNQKFNTPEDQIFANTINGFSKCLKNIKPDLVVVHGDRVEALSAAVTSLLNNVSIAHIEGGEVSGTKDEIIRHSISKLANFHFVSNKDAIKRLLQLGENRSNIFKIGSPEIDIFKSRDLPSLAKAKKKYSINFNNYAILIYHPDTEEIRTLDKDINIILNSLLESKINYIVIHPNNDPGSNYILNAYKKFKKFDNFNFFPSMRFEYYITLLKNADFIIGNSSSGVREAPAMGIKSINLASRQLNRSKAESIINCRLTKKSILDSIKNLKNIRTKKTYFFGNGNSDLRFQNILLKKSFWETRKIKKFIDIN